MCLDTLPASEPNHGIHHHSSSRPGKNVAGLRSPWFFFSRTPPPRVRSLPLVGTTGRPPPPYARCPGLRRALRRRRRPTRYAHPSPPSFCAKPSAQTLTQAIWLSVFGSDLTTRVWLIKKNKCILCIMPTDFDFLFAKKFGCTCVHPCPLLGQFLSEFCNSVPEHVFFDWSLVTESPVFFVGE